MDVTLHFDTGESDALAHRHSWAMRKLRLWFRQRVSGPELDKRKAWLLYRWSEDQDGPQRYPDYTPMDKRWGLTNPLYRNQFLFL